MNYKIRLATTKDIEALAILKQRVWEETYRGIYNDDIIDNFDYEDAKVKFQRILDNSEVSLYVVESDGKVEVEAELVGYMRVGIPNEEFVHYHQEIGLLYIRKDFQRQGIGKELFHLGCQKIKENGYHEFFVPCNKYNINARQFYEKMGGKIIAEDEDRKNKRNVQVKYYYEV